MNSHDAAVAFAARFLDLDRPTEEEIEWFYLEVFPRMTEEQRDLIFDWLLSAVGEITLKDVDQLIGRVRQENASEVDLDTRSSESSLSYARGP